MLPAVRSSTRGQHDPPSVNARRLIVRLAAAGLVVGALSQSAAPGLAQDPTTSTPSRASDPSPTTPASTLGTTTPTTGTTGTTTGAAPTDLGTTITVPAPSPPARPKRKSTNTGKPGTGCTTGTARKRVAIRSAQENAVGQPPRRAPAATPRCNTA